MKKSIYFAFVVLLGSICTTYIYEKNDKCKTKDLVLANIEALANYNETDPNKRDCYRKWRKAPDDDDLAIWATTCQDCEFYWLLEAGFESKCNK